MEKIGKVQISKAADDALEAAVDAVNNGFNGGRVSKSDVATWVILRMVRDRADDIIDPIRKDHFDEVTYLEHVVREMKSAQRTGTGQDTSQLATLLAPLSVSSKGSRQASSPGKVPARPKPQPPIPAKEVLSEGSTAKTGTIRNE